LARLNSFSFPEREPALLKFQQEERNEFEKIKFRCVAPIGFQECCGFIVILPREEKTVICSRFPSSSRARTLRERPLA
jgi:hypothetical protein